MIKLSNDSLDTSQNRVCALLGIELPVIEGGLAYVGNGLLAAAVSEGGGFGQIGCAGRTVDNFEREIVIASQKTNKPFGVNLPISAHSDYTPYFEIVRRHKSRIKAVSFGGGNPAPYIQLVKEIGLIVMVVISTPVQAAKAEAFGADIVICEGYEAGGHNGKAELTSFTLIPQIARAVSIPIVAAGGVCDARGFVASLVLGADGVQMGTRFVATTECEAHTNYKELLTEAKGESTTVISRHIKGPLRVYKNEYAQRVMEIERQNWDKTENVLPFIKGTKNKTAAIDGVVGSGYIAAGQVASLIDHIESASEIVRRMSIEAAEILQSFHRA
ncbi:NAD(P)H-dependent flavin oxidoreductase [Peribacillus glennii]|uniref:Probable nitronate monooxygenase n=1 Tax=Peribacillus glennii TaxID=2303991 RepID=A0A372LFF8_9BACI|nr:nitronate monooxygenase [Peribacillus glennii]RFU64987.1 2-nitropropane dioxygenase [Peribacillus glennii]